MGWSRFFRRSYWDQERTRELESYLAIEIDENIARGVPPDEARYAARRRLGSAGRVREEIYRMNSLGFLETLWQDLRFGARLLRLNPGFAAVAILSLALGIGANTAIFQLLDAVRLRALPVQNPQELALVRIANRERVWGRFRGRHSLLTNPVWEQIRDRQQVFSGIFAWANAEFNLARGGEVRPAQALWVSGDFFRVLGVTPILGRIFTPADDQRGCGSPGVVISYPFWQREFGGEASALGKPLSLDGHLFEILGVTPADFYGVEVGRSFDVAVPLCSERFIAGVDTLLDKRHGWWLAAMGRLKPGYSLTQATAQLNAISPGVFEATVPPNYKPDTVKNYLSFKLAAFPGGSGLSSLRRDYETPLWLLMAIAGLVLLIACANLANLMLARTSAREREIAVRLSLGASRRRVIGQLLSESLLLAAIGAMLGAVLARVLSRSLVSFLSTRSNPLFVDLEADWRLFAFTAGIAILTCMLFGLTPALRATRTGVNSALKSGGRGLTASRERFGLRRALVVSQVALSLVLLVGALLFVRSFRNLLTLDAGFRRDGLLIAEFDLRRLQLPKNRRPTFEQELLDRLRAAPGVDSAAVISNVPVTGNGWNDTVLVEDAGQERKGLLNLARISPQYFKTIGTPLLAGRDFSEQDTLTSPKVAIVTQTFARQFLNGASPIGRTFRLEAPPGRPEPSYEIVGLAKNIKYGSLREEYTPVAFFPASQDINPYPLLSTILRSRGSAAGLISTVKSAVAGASPDIDINFYVFGDVLAEGLLRDRLMATLSGFFGLLAAVLATIGLYGVISYMVVKRGNEIGIRMALGASQRTVVAMILREATVLLGIGLTLGSALALAGARVAEALLFGLRPNDPGTLAMGIAALATVAAAASYLPARRASRLDPMAALREE
jgi:predicted permease